LYYVENKVSNVIVYVPDYSRLYSLSFKKVIFSLILIVCKCTNTSIKSLICDPKHMKTKQKTT